jgi:hypothetical protein
VVPARAPNYVTITCASDVTGFDAVRVGRGMPRAPVPFCGCGGTPHGRGSFAERTVSVGRLSGRGKGVAKQTGVATRGPLLHYVQKRGCWYLVAPEPFGATFLLKQCGHHRKNSLNRFVLKFKPFV